MTYQSVIGRDVNPWITHFKQQADGTGTRRMKDGILLVSNPPKSGPSHYPIPVQNLVSPVQQTVDQAEAQIKKVNKTGRSIKRHRSSIRNQKGKKQRRDRKSPAKKTTKKRRQRKNKHAEDIFKS